MKFCTIPFPVRRLELLLFSETLKSRVYKFMKHSKLSNKATNGSVLPVQDTSLESRFLYIHVHPKQTIIKTVILLKFLTGSYKKLHLVTNKLVYCIQIPNGRIRRKHQYASYCFPNTKSSHSCIRLSTN